MQNSDDPLIGKVVGRNYKIVELIGEGGMSRVYKAHHLLLQKNVALKFILPKFVYDAKSVRRFQQEARAAAALKHPNICSVSEFGVDEDGRSFIVMDLIDGQSLADLLAQHGPCPVSKAIEIIKPVCEALAHAHSKGVVHRDLKPDNIVFAHGDQKNTNVQLVDFGIAKLTYNDEDSAPNLTKTGELLGTPNYMSPEQCVGKKVDHRSDLYSIGCVLFELLTGVPPFQSDTAMGVLLAHVSEPIPTLPSSVPVSMQKIIYRCLQKDPQQRYQDAMELIVDLEQMQTGAPGASAVAKTYIEPPRWQDSGSISDRYQIIEQIGQGGMGIVLKALHLALNKTVAIKVLNPGFHLDAMTMKRFELEAKASSKLAHPNLVTAFDYGFTPQNEPYLVMEYIDGQSLESLLHSKGTLCLSDFFDYMAQICKALNYIHKNGIIHRDIKTSNIIVQEIEGDRYVKLLDLGIAKVLSEGESPQQQLTAAGTIFGSPPYMSPEQCMGKETDARTDIYSLGCVMYECLAGHAPLAGENPLHTIYMQINHRPAKIEELDTRGNRGLKVAEIIDRCLEKNREHRFQTAQELLTALNAASILPEEDMSTDVKSDESAQRDKMVQALRNRSNKASPADRPQPSMNASGKSSPPAKPGGDAIAFGSKYGTVSGSSTAHDSAYGATGRAQPYSLSGSETPQPPSLPPSSSQWHEGRVRGSLRSGPNNEETELLDKSWRQVQIAFLDTLIKCLRFAGGLIGDFGPNKTTKAANNAQSTPWFLSPVKVLAILFWCMVGAYITNIIIVMSSGQYWNALNSARSMAEENNKRSEEIKKELERLNQPR